LNSAGKQTVQFFHFNDTRPQEVTQVFQDLFQKSSTSTARNNSTQTDPLVARRISQAQQSASSGGAGLGVSSGGLGGGSSGAVGGPSSGPQ